MATSPACTITTDFFSALMPSLSWTTPYPQDEKPAVTAPGAAVLQQNDAAIDRDQVLMDHLPLVRFVARRIHERLPQHVELEDLVSAGIVGLIDAFNKFDHARQVQFRSYAQFRIRGAILDSLRTLDWGSRDLRRKGRSMEEATQRLTQRLGRRPTETEVAAEVGISLSQYQQLLGELKGLEIGSLHETRNEDSAEEELAYVPTAPEEDPLYRCMQSEMSAHLREAIASLPEREARVLALYYVEEMTLKEIGAILGVVESRVSQIRATAVAGLRARMAGKSKVAEIRPRTSAVVHHGQLPAAMFAGSAARARQRGRIHP